MLHIRPAKLEDAAEVMKITRVAFKVYQQALRSDAPLSALTETIDDVCADIRDHSVYLAEEDGLVLGSIRVERLSADLAYIYRFSVNPEENNSGIGSQLLARALDDCSKRGYSVVALHTNSKYFKLARYYYGKEFYVHSTTTGRGYIRALFVKELRDTEVDLTPAFKK
ncbi:MAG: GNAT family N-acetyltransferase [Clostridiales bacterium]|jgi:predicted N-acetyltransferase YhbS|nr:GNAT family N-acetyltransferase [Clostridiales bacterium]